MLLIVTNKFDEHADLVIAELHKRDISFIRLNVEEFPQEITGNLRFSGREHSLRLQLPTRTLNLEDVSSVWYRRPKPAVIDEEVHDPEHIAYAQRQVKVFLDGLWHWMSDKCIWVNHPRANKFANKKVYQLLYAQQMGFTIPDTLISNDPNEVKAFVTQPGKQFILKGLHQSMLQKDKLKIMPFTHLIRPEDIPYLSDAAVTPTIFQEYMDKEVELRITIFGNQIFPIAIKSQETEQGKIDWRMIPPDEMPCYPYELPKKIEQMCFDMVHGWGLQFSTIDMLVTPQGDYVYLETNTNGQWAWLEEATGLPMTDALIELLIKQNV